MERPINEIVHEMDEITRRGVWQNIDNPEGLSQDILRLAVLNAGLGNALAEAKDIERRLETEYKYWVELDKLNHVGEGDSATVAESKARQQHYSRLKEWNGASKNSDMLKLKRDDVSKIIDAARSRLALIRQDIANS